MPLSRATRYRKTLAGIAVMWFLMAVSGFTVAGDLSIHLDVIGGIDAWLDGLSFSATIDGDVELGGDVPREDDMVWISATGSITGKGFYNPLELMTGGWILMTAVGQTGSGESVVFRSLLYTSRHSLVPLQAGDLFESIHHTVIQIGSVADVYWGEFTGTVTGGLAPTETEGTIRLEGRGNFSLSGERIPEASSTNYPSTIPLNDPNLTEAFLQTISAFFDLPAAQESLPVSDSP